MRILLLYDTIKPNSYADFLFQSFLKLFSQQNYFIEKTNSISEAKDLNVNNTNRVIVTKNNKRFLFFTKINLRFFLKKQKIEKLIQITNKPIFFLQLPQLIIPLNNEKLILKNKFLPSVSLAVCSHFAKQKLMEAHPLPVPTIQIFYAAADDIFQPISWSEQQAIKMQYTQGREYFLVTAEDKTFASFMQLLKAFSGFKKWQHSSMKLVVTGTISFANNEEWKEKISTYKYREDVVLLAEVNDEEYINLLAGAYVFIHTPSQDDDVLPLLGAAQCATPCLSFTTETMKEYNDNSVVLIEQSNYEQLNEKMILLYKDETLRSQLIAAGIAKAQHYSKEKTLQQLRSFITKRINT